MKYISILLALVFILFLNVYLFGQDEVKATERKGLALGTLVENFSAIDMDAKVFELNKALEQGPLVLVFYRGQWCPYCNKHLEILQDSLNLIEDFGARVVAISPEKPEYLAKMEEKTKASFTLLYDEDYAIEDAFQLTFSPGRTMTFAYNVFMGAKLKKAHSDDSQRLPIPATYILNQEGEVVWRHFDPNYKKRSSVKDILKALEDLK